MKTILYMVISIDGYTTGLNDDTSWVEDADLERMDDLMVKSKVMLMGSGTYFEFDDELPNDQALLVVFTRKEKLLKKKISNIIFTDKKPREILQTLEKKGFAEVMLAGGAELATSFFQAGLIDEVWLIRKPLLLGQGKSLLNFSLQVKLKLLQKIKLGGGSYEFRYKVVKKDDNKITD